MKRIFFHINLVTSCAVNIADKLHNFGESWKKEEERNFLQGFRKNQLNNKKFT